MGEIIVSKRFTWLLKYFIISILVGIVYYIICYIKSGNPNIISILLDSGILFLFLCMLAFISPKSRKVFGFKDEN